MRVTEARREKFIKSLTDAVKSQAIGYFEMRGIAKSLLRNGASYARIQESHCNGCGYDALYIKGDDAGNAERLARQNKRQRTFEVVLAAKESRLETRIAELCKRFQGTPIFQGDPRGYTLRVVVPEGLTNDTRRDIPVPTS